MRHMYKSMSEGRKAPYGKQKPDGIRLKPAGLPKIRRSALNSPGFFNLTGFYNNLLDFFNTSVFKIYLVS